MIKTKLYENEYRVKNESDQQINWLTLRRVMVTFINWLPRPHTNDSSCCRKKNAPNWAGYSTNRGVVLGGVGPNDISILWTTFHKPARFSMWDSSRLLWPLFV